MAIQAGKDLTSKGFVEELSEDTLCECHAVEPFLQTNESKALYPDNHAHHLHFILLSLPLSQLHGPPGILSHENDHGSAEHCGLSYFLSPADTIDVGESQSCKPWLRNLKQKDPPTTQSCSVSKPHLCISSIGAQIL